MTMTHIIPTEFGGDRPTLPIVWFTTNGMLWGIDSKGRTFELAPSAPKGREPGFWNSLKNRLLHGKVSL